MVIVLLTSYLTFKNFQDISSGFFKVIEHQQKFLDIGSFAMDIGAVLNEIWVWLLYNLITPFLIIVFLLLFFVGQYYLIKAYFFIIRKGYVLVTTASNKVLQTDRGSRFISSVLEPFDDFRK